jgi:hypothetical protein
MQVGSSEERKIKKEKKTNNSPVLLITIIIIMKKSIMLISFVGSSICLFAQSSYPVPDYSNEIYLVKKDTGITLMRLEKGSSKQEMKLKMMGMGGMDQGYTLEGETSTVHLPGGSNLVFILYTGAGAYSSNPEADSMMKANGIDPTMLSNPMGMMDPTQNITLYSMTATRGQRKAMLQSMGIMGKSKKTATKYTLSVKKVKEGYYEMIVDKTLPKGEYTFVMASMSMDQQFSLFAFAVD